MGLILFLLFLATPLIEIAVFIEVGGAIGLWPTIAIVILTAALGAALWRAQGLAVWARAQASLNRGELPVREVTDGAFLLVAGALLLTPGFVTDAIGFLLFVPPFRRWLAGIVFRYLSKRIHVHVVNDPGGGGPTIDGDAIERDD
ncbi:FxsA family protein [bacterium AH-315-P15]|nr:FxsA family protein [bacterium AH-315-P15]